MLKNLLILSQSCCVECGFAHALTAESVVNEHPQPEPYEHAWLVTLGLAFEITLMCHVK